MVIKRCDICGKKFEADYDGWFNYCSDECKKEGKRIFSTITKKCRVCGREFETDRKNTSCCSDECKKEANRIRNREGYEPAKPVSKVCKICGKEFEGHGNAKYCSDECREEANRIRNREGYEPAKPVTKVCKICGKEFEAKYRTIYCDECKEKRYKSKRVFLPLIKTCKICGKNYVTIFENSVYCSDECRVKGGFNKRNIFSRNEYGKSYNKAINKKKQINPVCEVTGVSYDLVIHHLYSFDTHPELGADLNNMVRINRKIHDKFHIMYGYGNNTREQWIEFVENMGFTSRPSTTKIKCIVDEEIDDGVFISRPSST